MIKTLGLTALLTTSLYQTAESAVNISSNNTGQAIIIPFYTVSNKMNTLLSLNNTTEKNKAVKIHFKEAKNGDLLASFNVYLKAQDMWTMAAGQLDEQIRMISNDQSCTIGFPNNVLIPVEADWLWENGTIEIIEMGTAEDNNSSIDYSNCSNLNSLWEVGNIWSNNSENLMSSATGGLHAEVTLMDIEQGHSGNIPVNI